MNNDNTYELVLWSDSQELMDKSWFKECFLADNNTELHYDIAGSSAFFVPTNRLKELYAEQAMAEDVFIENDKEDEGLYVITHIDKTGTGYLLMTHVDETQTNFHWGSKSNVTLFNSWGKANDVVVKYELAKDGIINIVKLA